MSKRLLAGWIVMSFLALCLASQATLAAQPLECPTESSGALMPASYRAYPEAAELARILSDHNFVVKCICLSKLDGFVPGTKGAALYLTDQGDFDVVFLPKPQTFEAFEIIERHRYGGYEYSFRGSPPKKNRMLGPRRTYFFKDSNQLFIVWDMQTATRLGKFLNSR
jgi:hypothetical protein